MRKAKQRSINPQSKCANGNSERERERERAKEFINERN